MIVIGDFLENISLLSAVDMEDEEDSNNKVALMTVHSSKGLEFPYVFVAGLEENIFPSGSWMAAEAEIEEERRLCYVAMTRAKKALQLSFAQTRMRNGKHESNSPSRFVREVDPKYIANPLTKEDMSERSESNDSSSRGWGTRFGASVSKNTYGRSGQVVTQKRTPEPVRKPEPIRRTEPTVIRRVQPVPQRQVASDFEPTPILQLRAGQRVEHNRFGFGQILEISGNTADLKAKIAFDEHGEKTLILKYAKIRVVQG